jgi:hypothetical protein
VVGGMLGELVVRYERKVEMYRAFVLIAFILICLCTFLEYVLGFSGCRNSGAPFATLQRQRQLGGYGSPLNVQM